MAFSKEPDWLGQRARSGSRARETVVERPCSRSLVSSDTCKSGLVGVSSSEVARWNVLIDKIEFWTSSAP